MNPPRRRILAGMKITLTFLLLSLFAASFMIAAEPPAEGTKAPDFTLKSQENKPVSLHDFKGKYVVLYFYPKDQTRGCTIEAQNFQRDLAQYTAKNAVILGVSVDNAESHQAFCAKESLTFKLLADDAKEVTTKYGSLKDYGGAMGQAAARNTFLIGPDGTIKKFYVVTKIPEHSAEVLAAIQ
jgi:thioredoxin-dependent peroxiredoxin